MRTKKEGRGQHGDGDVEELLDRIGAVDLGRFVEMRRNILQPGQIDDRPTAHTPQTHQNHRGDGPIRAQQPAGRVGNPNRAQALVDRAQRPD